MDNLLQSVLPTNIHIIAYADDIALLVAGDTRKEIIELTEKDLIIIDSAFDYDIGRYFGKNIKLNDFTKFQLLENPWFPSNTYNFPFSLHSKGGRDVKRFVGLHHLKAHHWLVLSDLHRGLYCKYCVLFSGEYGSHQSGSQLGKLVKKPLTSFAKLYGKDGYLTTHENSKYHKDAVSAGKDFLITYHAPQLEVINQVNSQRLAQAQENRSRLRPIIETIILCGRQNIPLRGHRDDGYVLDQNIKTIESSESVSSAKNDGNFRELLRFRVAAGDTKLENHLKNASANATYIGKNTQNELINACGEEVLQNLIEKVHQSRWFSIIFDETTDAAHREQMSISLRYVHNKTIREDFISFVDCYESIRSEDIEGKERRLSGKVLGHIVIDFYNCAVMSSEINGAVQEIRKVASYAKRCPCMNHSLNNSLKRSNNILACQNTINKMKEIIAFSNSSAKITNVFRTLLGRSFSGLCETRWQEKHDGTIQFCTYLPEKCEGLEKITHWIRSPDTSTKAHSLLNTVTSSEFIVTTFALSDVLGTTLPLSRLLQSIKLDAVTAIDAYNDVLSVLQTKRENADPVFQQIFKKAQNMASKLDVEIIKPRIAKRSVYRANQLNSDSIPEVFYRISIYIPILDSVINDLQNRFSEDVLNSFDLRILMPATIDFEALKKSEENNAICLEAEYDVWLAKWNRVKMNNGKIPETALEVLDVCDVDMFPAIHTLIHILATLPVSVATAERSFSTLRRLKTWLRTRMVEDRLNGLALMHIHRDISIDID
ncbi:52 kDa repressor of the inhibitor of the protein kinase-like [Melanaphis sacchari]|uniref:52 kDa repressor of the inhibitor of the protein kinase-like n=1 Tax=Melanaphis sacchari TaxID=742174 RepID=UPI000DC12D65|nr:52 kDa repressor of the inhibitor of the protein kinase-like [Melanaphis sacchari]